MVRDTDVIPRGSSLKGLTILLGIAGGIAAVESVRLARELRRHGASLRIVMTTSAQSILRPKALEWASQEQVITAWDPALKQLDDVDGLLIAPATRNLMASHLHGMMSSPLLMAMSAARRRGTPVMLVPSMHDDLAEDPVTERLVKDLRSPTTSILWSESDEGRRKQPDATHVVASFSHHLRAMEADRRSVVVTLGATRSPIDDVRSIQNRSSGQTGWRIAEDLHRHGHDVTVVAGSTTDPPSFPLPLVIHAPEPSEMLAELLAIAKDDIDAWVRIAAVLDYVVEEPVEGKIASLQGRLDLALVEGTKHIMELAPHCEGSVRIGFKLESGVKLRDLIPPALAQLERAQMTAVIANRLEDLDDPKRPRAHMVDRQGASWVLESQADVNRAIRTLIERGP